LAVDLYLRRLLAQPLFRLLRREACRRRALEVAIREVAANRLLVFREGRGPRGVVVEQRRGLGEQIEFVTNEFVNRAPPAASRSRWGVSLTFEP
jgi:hypothetical protein